MRDVQKKHVKENELNFSLLYTKIKLSTVDNLDEGIKFFNETDLIENFITLISENLWKSFPLFDA